MLRFTFLLFCVLCFKPAFSASRFQDLQLLIDQNLFAPAVVAGEELLVKHPGNARIQFLTAYAYQMDKQVDQAKKLYQSLIKDYPELPEPRNNLAMIYLDQGDSDKAIQILIDALNTNLAYSTAYKNLGKIYRGIASETYRRAVSDANQPEVAAPEIELAVLSKLNSADKFTIETPSAESSSLVNTANVQTLLIEQIKNWANAWEQRDIPAYINFYSNDHRPNFETHKAWVEHRRKRIMRPGDIVVRASDIEIRAQGENRAIIDFIQTYDSPNYSDRVLKRLGFRRIGSQWKIATERVISIL
jgi:tetratricopeptide (TPR) repeat protein